MQHLLEDIQACQTKRKTSQQGECVQEELDWKELKLRLDATRYRFLKQRLTKLNWVQQAEPPVDHVEYIITFEKVLDSLGGDRSFDDAVDASMEEDFHIETDVNISAFGTAPLKAEGGAIAYGNEKEVWQWWKVKLDAERYRFLKKYYLFTQHIYNDVPEQCRWEYRVRITEVIDDLAIDMSFDDAVDALMKKKSGVVEEEENNG